jgi:hypothetical protein
MLYEMYASDRKTKNTFIYTLILHVDYEFMVKN